MPLRSGETFANFRIIKLVGAGGMGEVYLVQHPRLPRKYALKVLPTEISVDADYCERFTREADMAARLTHPNIVGVHDRGEHDGQLWIAMDYVNGPDAGQLLRDRYPAGLPADDVVEIITAVGEALDYAHDQGLLHRDVKPANILLESWDERSRRVLLADFGIARNVGEISGLTATNMTLGTVAYAAPEQLMGELMDGRADQYALAASAHQLLTGMQLFPHSNPAAVISRHLTSPPPKVSDSVSGLGSLDPALAAALAKNPDDRFARCADFASALAAAAETTTPHPTAPTAPAPTTRPPSARVVPEAGSRPSKRLTLTASVAATVLAVVGGLVLTITRPWDSAPSATSSSASTSLAAGPTATEATTAASPPSIATTPSPPSTSAAAPPPAQNFALPGCTSGGAAAIRPDFAKPTCNRQHWIEGLTWTQWSATGAAATGIEQSQNCDPYCAVGEISRNSVQVLFTGKAPMPARSGCPTDLFYYTQMIVAYPDLAAVPFELSPEYAVTTRYNGMPAIRYNSLDVNCRV